MRKLRRVATRWAVGHPRRERALRHTPLWSPSVEWTEIGFTIAQGWADDLAAARKQQRLLRTGPLPMLGEPHWLPGTPFPAASQQED